MNDQTKARPVIALEKVPTDKFLWWLAGCEYGLVHGAAAADEQRFAELTTEAVKVARRMANIPPRDVLEELRGNPTRAQAFRDFWAATGLREDHPRFTPVDDRVRSAFIDRCRASWGLPTSQEVAA